MRDNGPGIDRDEQRAIFEQFSRGRAAHQGGAPGVGLGLSFVRAIVRGHRGKIDVVSRPGDTAFRIRIKRRREPRVAPQKLAEARNVILIVEDDEAIATGLALNFKLAGHPTVIARDGQTAVDQATSQDFALILLDINLPKKNGLEVLSTLRAADNLVPVIVLSARDGEFDKVAALRLGADDYVTKPFALAELLARVDAVLRRASQTTVTPVELPASDQLGFDDVAIDLGQRVATRDGEEVKLTHLEFELLVFFVRHPSQVFSRSQLFQLVWGQSAGSVRTVDNFVGQLRKRFEANPEQPVHFITVRGSGYRFDP